MEKEIEALKRGEDSLIRFAYTEKIIEVIQRSNRGEIGFGDFIEDIRKLVDEMEATCNKYWTE